MNKKKVKLNPITTVTGIVTKNPQRVNTTTDKVMASVMIDVQSNKRSNYPMKVIGFDEHALNLMLCRKGKTVIISGRFSYWRGYQIIINKLSYIN
ncbi:hypothetical protein FH869_06470 [Providencia rettgeri]|uniref:hypothetical protein n=1 Tax=Providencia rettgeri TaxID=587 RepID=UPI0011224F48|nr:hypothetical protein [Providencia rettgeri]TNV03298.1 hypothetical protein FH869_06470 [Providencia rettgeri]